MIRNVVRWVLWPVFIVAGIVGFGWGSSLGLDANQQMMVPGLFMIVLFGLERWLPHHGDGGHPEVRHDVGHILLGFAGNPLGAALFLVAAAAVAGTISDRWGGNLWPTEWHFAAEVGLVIVCGDAIEYWRHRMGHHNAFFWRFHSLHHSVQSLDVLKSGRNHFMDMVLRALFVFTPLVIIGVPAEILPWYAVAVTILGPIAHANLDLRVPSWMHRVFLTPELHRIHHARALELAQSNFANVMPIWDMLFGTYRGHEHDTDTFGIEDDPMPSGFMGQIIAPFTPSFGKETELAPQPTSPTARQASSMAVSR
jgi:sterol desaturase/sphingolipid hydroxylase (fatty acid hydroxylase superfamily)